MDWALTGAIIGLIIAFCYLLDWLVSKEEEDRQKVTIVKWWSRLDDFSYGEAVHNSNVFCNKLLDKIYGKRHFSRRCIAVSLCVSILSVMILSIAAFSIRPNTLYSQIGFRSMAFGLLWWAITINCWIDYVSLVETRLVLRFASRVRLSVLLVLLLADLFISAILFFLAYFVFLWVSFSLLDYRLEGLGYEHMIRLAIQQTLSHVASLPDILMFSTTDDVTVISIYFYSTLSTSVIFYVYCLSALLFKLLKLSKTRIMVVLEKLEKSDNLFKALGGFLAAIVLVVKCTVELVQHIRQG